MAELVSRHIPLMQCTALLYSPFAPESCPIWADSRVFTDRPSALGRDQIMGGGAHAAVLLELSH